MISQNTVCQTRNTDVNCANQIFGNKGTVSPLISSVNGVNKETFSLEEAANYLHIEMKSVEYYSKRKRELSYVPLGKGELVFRKSDLDEFLEKKLRKGFIVGGQK